MGIKSKAKKAGRATYKGGKKVGKEAAKGAKAGTEFIIDHKDEIKSVVELAAAASPKKAGRAPKV